MKKYSAILATLFFISLSAHAVTSSETGVNRYLASIMDKPDEMAVFIRDLPKGGDLHHHANGSSFPQKLVEYAAADNLCVDRATFAVSAKADCPVNDLLNNAWKDTDFRHHLTDAWTMQHFKGRNESAHDHFFGAFSKFKAITHQHSGEILAEVAERTMEQNALYLETMLTADGNTSGQLGKKLGWDPDFNTMRAKLLANHLDDSVKEMTRYLDASEAKMYSLLQCSTANHQSGCDITLRYQYQVSREQPPEMVFAQLLAGFEAMGKEKRIVTINMVAPEDGKISMRDYKLHMQMIAYLRGLYPNAHVTLHAGELTNEVAPEEGLKFHINDAVMVAKAERIGHGVDIQHEENYTELLKYMADHHVMVEINLSSNDYILHVKGNNHPLPLYLQYGVPVAISTDDEGVTQDVLGTEYMRAVTTYHLNYITLKNIVRNSIEYSFLPGESLWQNHHYDAKAAPCTKELSASCKAFLAHSEKAALQWKLEERFNQFETDIMTRQQ